MIFKKYTFLAAFIIGTALSLSAQVKIGYTNIELVMVYMPESKTMSAEIDSFEKQLTKRLMTKKDYYDTQVKEYQECVAANTCSPDEQKAKIAAIQKLEGEIQKSSQEAQYKVLQKREELMTPILEKLQKAIDEVAAVEGYTYILNQTNSSGVSTILYGPDENNVTEKLMAKLGIEIPKSE